MLQNLFSIRQFWLTKWSILVHSTMCNAPYKHPSHDSILELWRTFMNVLALAQFNQSFFWPFEDSLDQDFPLTYISLSSGLL